MYVPAQATPPYVPMYKAGTSTVSHMFSSSLCKAASEQNAHKQHCTLVHCISRSEKDAGWNA